MRHGELQVWSEEWNSVPVIGAAGEVDLGTIDAFRSITSEVVRRKPKAVIFDLRQVTFIDSTGLGIMVATRKRLQNVPGAVTVITEQPAVLQSLNLTGLDRVFEVRPDNCTVASKS